MAKQTNREKAIIALINAPTITQAAKDSGIGEATFYRLLKDADFLKEYRSARRATVENAITQIQGITSEAVETLKRNLHCENPNAEIRAAQIILDNSLKGVELIDILERLEVIEANQNNEHQKQN